MEFHRLAEWADTLSDRFADRVHVRLFDAASIGGVSKIAGSAVLASSRRCRRKRARSRREFRTFGSSQLENASRQGSRIDRPIHDSSVLMTEEAG
jgi:hypothetical protein